MASFDSYHADYDEALGKGLWPSGEGKEYFARQRIVFLARCLRRLGAPPPDSVLDFGCGTGTATPFLIAELSAGAVVGVDASPRCVEAARRAHGSAKTTFFVAGDYRPAGDLALAYCNGVFHHVPEADQAEVLALVRDSLRPGGIFALWENNPWNPGTRYVMSHIPFDKDAVPLSSPAARRLVSAGGLEVLRTDYLFLFPRWLRVFRFIEPWLSPLPLGGQYQVLCRRRD